MNFLKQIHVGVLVILATLLSACGGVGGGMTPPTGPSPSFTISLSPSFSQSSPLSVTIGSATTPVSVTVTGQNGFTGTVSLALNGLPAGVTATPANSTVAVGQSQQIALAASVDAPLGVFQATVSGSSGSLSTSSVLFGNVSVPPGSAVIGSAGGIVAITEPSSPIKGVQLVVPPNALSGNVLIQMDIVPPNSVPKFRAGSAFTGMAVELLPSGLQFAVPASLSLPFEDIDQDGVLDGSNVLLKTLGMVGFDQQTQLFSIEECFVDVVQKAVICDISGFSSFFQLYTRIPSNQTVTYSFGTLPTNNDGSDLPSAIIRALNTWSLETAKSGISFAVAHAGSSPDILFSSQDFGPRFCAAFAVTGTQQFPICWNACTVTFNNGPDCNGQVRTWTGDPMNTVGTVQIGAVTLHEVGHVLGLQHSCKNCRSTTCPGPGIPPITDVMAARQDPSCPPLSLGRGDVVAYRRHYGLLYAESGVGTASGPSTLYTVDPVTPGVDFPIGVISLPNGSTPAITDIAQSSSGQLFGIDFANLYAIDSLSGQAQLIGPLGLSGFNALSFDRQDRLFGASSTGTLVTIDTNTGTAQVVGSYGSGFAASGDIVFVPTGIAYGTAKRLGDLNDQLVNIDPTSGQASLIMDLGTANVFGFVWTAPSVFGPWTPCFVPFPCQTYLFFGLTTDSSSPSSAGDLLLIDPVVGTAQFVRKLTFNAFGGTAASRPAKPVE